MAHRGRSLIRFGACLRVAAGALLLRRPRPYLFVLVINDRCNLDCFYCESKNTGRYDLEAGTVRRSLRDAAERGHRALVLTGGEPTLWESGGSTLADVVGWARESGFLDVAIYTNGTLPLSIEGCTYLVTVDGTRAAHNEIRKGTYDAILENVRRSPSRVIASMTLSRASERDLEAAVDSLAATGLFSGISFNLLTGAPALVDRDGLLGARRSQVLDRLWALKGRGYPILLSHAAYRALRDNSWKRPIRQIELMAGGRLFPCCRDVERPDVCAGCGYSGCAEIACALSGRPSAVLGLLTLPVSDRGARRGRGPAPARS